jgi:hypothetical protein
MRRGTLPLITDHCSRQQDHHDAGHTPSHVANPRFSTRVVGETEHSTVHAPSPQLALIPLPRSTLERLLAKSAGDSRKMLLGFVSNGIHGSVPNAHGGWGTHTPPTDGAWAGLCPAGSPALGGHNSPR